jgi:hypothetical protein
MKLGFGEGSSSRGGEVDRKEWVGRGRERERERERERVGSSHLPV